MSSSDISFHQALSERYLSYALSTIISRSLPDVRDGLKPVHRRLIYAMAQLKLNPESGFKKCARVVGDVMGKFHPHGDAAIYGALVRLAQDFSLRYPLIEGQGNFGNIDGDSAAAMRYTEARLSELGVALLEGLEDNTVDFRPTYDGEEEEPIILPASFPNLLANGATGIAVGMATSIPPHNLEEIIDAAICLIKDPHAATEELMNYLLGPDFPTGGIIVESKESMLQAYKIGRGRFRIRSRFSIETLKGGGYQIIISEIPYQVEKSKLIEKIANLILDKKAPFLEDIQDESTDTIRIVLIPKNKTINPDRLMETLYKQTDLESIFSLNMNVLNGKNIPSVMGLKEILRCFLDYRLAVQKRQLTYRLEKILKRLHLLTGFLIVYQYLEEVIRIIRDEDHPKAVLTCRFNLDEEQAEAILNMRLRSLRKLQEQDIKKEFESLKKEEDFLTNLLNNENKQWNAVKQNLESLKKRFGKHTPLGKRRTSFSDMPSLEPIAQEELIEKEDITIVCSKMGWLRALKGHNIQDIRYKEGDEEYIILKTTTASLLLLFASNGRFYTLEAGKIPRPRGGYGEPIRLLIDLPNTEELLSFFVKEEDQKYLLIADDGKGFLVKVEDTIAHTKSGKQVLIPNNKAQFCAPVTGDHIAIIGQNRKLLIFPIAEIPTLSRGRGIRLQKYKDDGLMSDARVFIKEEGLKYARNEKITILKDLRAWEGKRGSSGRLAPIGFARDNSFNV